MQTSDSVVLPGALEGIRVVDLGQYLAGPLVAMFLADNGADVIHIDPPGGPRWDHPTNAALYRNKRSVRHDIKSGAGNAEVRRLIASADIVVENFRPGVMARLDLEAGSFAGENDRLIWCSLPGFAAEDPRAGLPAWEGVVCSAAGLYPPEGWILKDRPLFNALPLASNFAAFMATHRIVAALLARNQSGHGEYIEVSLYEACFQALGQYAEVPKSRSMPPFLTQMYALFKVRPAADGSHVYFDSPFRGLQRFLDRFLPGYDLLDLDENASQRLELELDDLMLRKSGAEWERIGQEELKCSLGLVQSSEDWLSDRHALDSQSAIEVDDPELGSTVQAGFPVLLSRTPPSVRWPREAAAEGSLGTRIDWLSKVRNDPAPAERASDLPLDGVRVLDCSSLLAGPTTARVLAQYGAEVIKIDRAGVAVGDVNPMTDDLVAFVGDRTANAGKRMVFLDLKSPDGQEILAGLVRSVDIVHHNFTPEAAVRLGLSSERVHGLNSAAILSTMSLHSWGGFRSGYRGHDMVAQMATGMGTRMGGAARPKNQAIVINDHAAGHLNAFGIMLALLHRNRTGEAQDVNASLSTTATMHQFPFMVSFAGRVWDEPTGTEVLGWHPLDRLYRGKDGWFYVANGHRFAERSILEKIRFLSDEVGQVTDQDLEDWLESRFAELSVEESVAGLTEVGFGAHRYIELADLLIDQFVLDRHLVAIIEHPGIGRAMGIGNPVLGSADKVDPKQLAARRPGMDTLDVLAELGFEDQEILKLIRDRVIGIGENPIVTTTDTHGYWTMARNLTPHLSPDQTVPIIDAIAHSIASDIHFAQTLSG